MAGLETSDRWRVLEANPAVEQAIRQAFGVPALVARVFAARGYTDLDAVERLLTPSLERDWRDPSELPGMTEAADRVERAVRSGETIAVFGDFDVDGMSSASLLTLALRDLGATVSAFIPRRFEEGYGLSAAALNRVVDSCSPDLIVTVDNGIASAAEVAAAVERGIDVVVTDHHEPGSLVPQGVPVTDPKLDTDCPSRDLAGAGVALKLVCELGRRLGRPDLWRGYTDLASLGTVSDMMELTGENRALVADGVASMRATTRPGLVALAASSRADLASIESDDLPFSLVPRLNAAGRMGDVDVAFDLLVSADPVEASVLAGRLEAINEERRSMEAAMVTSAEARAAEEYDGGPCLVLGGEGWHEGVKGIVASRMVNRYHVPCLLFSVADGEARGSGRSVGSVDLFHAVEGCADLLTRFGGHAGAVGVTLPADRLPVFRERLSAELASLPAEQFASVGEVACVVTLDELTMPVVQGLDLLRPFGQGNKKPLLAVRGVTMRGAAAVGTSGDHVRFFASDGANSVAAIMFRVPDVERALTWEGTVDLVFEAEVETWQGRSKVKLKVRDILYRDGGAPGAACAEEPVLVEGTAGEQAASDLSDAGAAERARLAALDGPALTDALRQAFIGDRELLPAQATALEMLDKGQSVLEVMATGRGKSLVFHIHGARLALAQGKASVFVFPLRALVNDQAFHLERAFSRLGLGVRVLTGETPAADRDRALAGLADGSVDIVLTTPEFLVIHKRRFAAAGRVGFVVVDEAHHAGMGHVGAREAYQQMPEVLELLGSPQVLAATATASDSVAQEVCRLLSVDRVVQDRTVRSNLSLVDHRGLRDRGVYAASVASSGDRCIVYVNTRDAACAAARELRHRLPDMAHRVAFYHGGLDRDRRMAVERAFRAGKVSCVVATSAFGEGVDLPDVRHVVLWSLPFDTVQFNQMSGRAGRDGNPAQVHVLFGADDAPINDAVLSSAAPARDALVALYRALRTLAIRAAGPVRATDGQVLDLARTLPGGDALTEAAVASGIGVFGELGFCAQEGFGEGRSLTMAESPGHMELSQSVLWREGLRSREGFRSFADWVLGAPTEALAEHVDRPIAPTFGVLCDS
ncbi:single-stranded-DNA-specific exonuclease RecJ [Atopobiaceae bacterium 24-176]